MPRGQPKQEKPTEEEIKAIDELWVILGPVIESAVEMKSVAGNVFFEAYNAVYNKRAFFQPGRYNFSGKLLKEHLQNLLTKFLDKLVEQESKLSPQGRVKHFGTSWEQWSKSCYLLTNLLMKVVEVVPDFDISVMMHSLWRTRMFSDECKGNIVGVACDIIDDYRHGNPSGEANLDLVRNLIGSLKVMDETEAKVVSSAQKANNPANRFVANRSRTKKTSETNTLLSQMQRSLLDHTKEFYKKESTRLETEQMTPGASLKYVSDICSKEEKLVKLYLKQLMKVDDVLKVLDEALVTSRIPFFLQGFETIVLTNDVELGQSMVKMFKRAQKVGDLVTSYGVIVKKHMLSEYEKKLEAATKDCREYIKIAASEYTRFDEFTRKTFTDVAFSDALKEAITSTLNDNAVLAKNIPAGSGNVEISKNMLAAKIFAQYINMIMIPSKEHLENKDREEAESMFITLFGFLKSKRDFLEQYRNGLARRLLRNDTVGMLIESAFLEKIKKGRTEDSLTFSTNMLLDIGKREDVSRRFSEFVTSHGESKCPVDPLLCSSSWPIKTVTQNYHMPEKMEMYVDLFQKFYETNFGDRGKKTVSLLHQYGTGDISFYSGGKKYELHGTQIHLIVLPMIRSSKLVTFKDIVDKTLVSLDDLKNNMAYLLVHGFVLAKNPDDKAKFDRNDRSTWLPETLLKASPKFSHPKLREFTIAVKREDRASEAASTISKEELKAAFDNYVMVAEANIVRIMKARRDLGVNDLFSETVKAVNRWFSLDKRIFTKALSELVDQEIVSREEGGKMKYIA